MQLGLYLPGLVTLSGVQSLRGHDAWRQRTSLLIVRTGALSLSIEDQ